MNRRVDPEFQRKLDDFNASKGGPARIEVAWNPKSERWEIWCVPVMDSTHPLARNQNTAQQIRPFPDDSGREGVFLNTWGTKERFEPLDDRLFEAINFADSFRDRHHFEEIIESPEFKAEARSKADLREKAAATRRYYQGIDSLTIGAHSKSADWRWRVR